MERSQCVVTRSYACNVELLVYLRQRKRWTQRELAIASGYSKRLISKAESGRSISRSTIEILAETLSTDDCPICLQDLVCDTVESAKAFMSALYGHQSNAISAIRHLLDDRIIFRIAGDPAMLPFAGEHVGIDAVTRALDIFFAVLEAPCDDVACHSYFTQGKDVIVWGASCPHPIGMRMPVAHRLSFQKGKIVLFEKVFDTLHAVRALGQRNGI